MSGPQRALLAGVPPCECEMTRAVFPSSSSTVTAWRTVAMSSDKLAGGISGDSVDGKRSPIHLPYPHEVKQENRRRKCFGLRLELCTRTEVGLDISIRQRRQMDVLMEEYQHTA